MLSHYSDMGSISKYLFSSYMPLFFIVSGYTAKQENFKSCFIKKSKRLLTPYFIYGITITACFTILPAIIFGIKKIHLFKWIGLFYSRYCIFPIGTSDNVILLYQEVSPLWFLTAMFLSFLLYNIYINSKRKVIIIVLYITLTVIFNFCPILMPWSIDTIFVFSLFIITGKYIRSILIIKKGKEFLIGILFLFMYIVLAYYNGDVNISIRNYGERGILSILFYYTEGLLFTIFLSKIFIKMGNNPLIILFSSIGRLSLRLMCLHMPIFIIIKTINPSYSVITSIISLLLSISICYIIDIYIRRFKHKYNILNHL